MTMTADDLAAITFSELKQLNDEDLALCVSKDAAIKICKKSVEDTEVEAKEIFHLWVHKFNKIFEVYKCDASEWQQLLEFFIAMVQQVTNLDMKESKFQTTDLLNVLDDALELLHWLYQLHVQLDTRKCCLSLQFALQTVGRFFSFYKSCDLQEILQQTLLLYNFALQVLTENVDNCRINDSDEFTQLTEVQSTLCTLIADAPALSLKTIIESWKCITKLTLHCAKYGNEMESVDAQQLVGMASRPVIFLIHEVGRSLNVVYKEDSLRQPIEQVEKYLRITNFYLKLLQRLADAFRHERFPSTVEFLKIFIASKNPPKYLSNTGLLSIVSKYVLNDLNEVFQMVYKHQVVLEILAEQSTAKKSSEYNIITKEFLHAILADKQENFINERIVLFIRIFQSLTKDVERFCQSEAYNEMVESFAAVAILNNSGELKKYLRSEVVGAGFQRSHASTDVLLTIASSSQMSSDELLQNFHYWRRCNQHFALFTSNPRELNVNQLLRHYYRRCQAKGLINKNELFVEDFENVNLMSLQLLNALPEVAKVVGLKLEKLLESFENSAVTHNIEDFYKILISLKALANIQEFEGRRDFRRILSLMLNVANTASCGSMPFSRLCYVVLELEAKHIKHIDDGAIFKTFEIIKQHSTKLNDCILPALHNFIQAAVMKSQKFQQSSTELLGQFSTKVDDRLLQNIFVLNKSKNNENCKMNIDLWPQLNLKPFLKHNCQSNMSPATKRLRLADDEASTLTLNEILEKSQKLLNQNPKLDAHDLQLLSRIKINLDKLEATSQQGRLNGS